MEAFSVADGYMNGGEMHCDVEFSGDRAVTAPMSWGQVAIWKSIVNLAPYDDYLNQLRILEVDGLSVDAARGMLGEILSRHESLRTRVVDVDGVPHQAIERSGAIPFEVVTSTATAIEEDTRLALNPMVKTRFDNLTDLPVRGAIGTVDGTVRRIGLVISHLAVDAPAIRIFMDELRAMVAGRDPGPPRGQQPVDLARHQLEPEPQQRSRQVIDAWMELYGKVSPSRLPRLGDVPDDAMCSIAVLVSPALRHAIRLVSRRHGVSPSTVLLAAASAVIGEWTGTNSCSLATIVHNRFQAGHRDIVSPMNQLGLVVVGMTDQPSFSDLLARTWRSAMNAHRNAYYDQLALDRSLAGAGADPGIEGHPYFCFNDIRISDSGPVEELDEARLRELLDRTTITTTLTVQRLSWQAILTARSSPEGTELNLGADTRYLSTELMERFLREVEQFIVEAAIRDGSVAELTAAVRSSSRT